MVTVEMMKKLPRYAVEWSQATGVELSVHQCRREAESWEIEAAWCEKNNYPHEAAMARQRAMLMREAAEILEEATQ